MNFNLDGTTLIIVAILAVVIVALIAWAIARRLKSRRLHKEFGPEYDHEVETSGSRSRAESELAARRERVAKYDLQDIPDGDRERLLSRWREVQRRFVDEPSEAVTEASALVDEAMQLRGYPLGEIRRKEADLSVHYPQEVQDYRRAYEIAERNRHGEATTEDLREATVAHRQLFEHLLGIEETTPAARRAAS